MDADDRELFGHLMAKATAMLEDAAEMVAEGQSSRISQDRMIKLGGRLQAAAKDIAALTGAAAIVASDGIHHDD